MNFLQKGYDAIENFFISNASDKKVLAEAGGRRDYGTNAPSSQIEYTAQTPAAKSLDDYIRSVQAATDPESPDWSLLYLLHENLLIDDHLESVTESRIAYTQHRKIKMIDDKGNESPELTSLFDRPWYEDMVSITVGHRFRGRRLMELFDLTDIGELEKVTEIKQPFFNTKKGIIIKRQGDTTGWNYREGAFADYYMQVGADDNLGMFTRMAPIVLAKKLGMGSWLDYIDKYGVPPLFITTDREDETRRQQLYAAAKKFKSNNFMIGRGSEKFEVPNIGASNTDAFERLATRADNMMSKRILGGTGLTDEKGFVGSVEIQYQLALNRFNSDGLFFKHYFNTQIKPRLVKLSPVYKPLEKFRLEFNDAKTLSPQEQIETVLKLGTDYDIDPEFITQLTGIPILGKKQTYVPGGDGGKK